MNTEEEFLLSIKKSFHTSLSSTPENVIGDIVSADTFTNGFMNILSAGRCTISSSISWKPENFPYFLLLYVTSGHGSYTIGNDTVELGSDSVFFMNCMEDFRINAISSAFSYYIVVISGPAVSSYYNAFHCNGSNVYASSSSSCIYDYFERLFKCKPFDQKYKRIAAVKWLTDILSEISMAEVLKTTHEKKIPDYLVNMKKLFDESYFQTYTLGELEELLGVSKYRLCREFSQYYELTPLQYLNNRRIDVAKDLLLNSDLPVHEVGSKVGIDNTNHFINLFKKNTGATPLVFRQAAPGSIYALHYPYTPGVPQ